MKVWNDKLAWGLQLPFDGLVSLALPPFVCKPWA